MIDFAKAGQLVATLPLAVRTEQVPLLQAGGRILAATIPAPWPLPRFDNSSMDGFAVRSADLAAATDGDPHLLPLAGESAAGVPMEQALPPQTAARISTGAPLPLGADAVVPVEAVRIEGERIAFTKPARPGAFIRHRGEDVPEASPLFGPGTRLDAPALAFLAMFNLAEVTVFARPRVGILTSGNEVRPHGTGLGPSDIVGVNIYYLEQELRAFGCETRIVGISPDEPTAFRRLLEQALADSDMVATTAGVSVGEHDVVGRAVADLGGEILFWRVSIRPGKPTLVARFGDKPLFALPGNPVAVCCNTEVIVKPFLRGKLGIQPVDTPREQVVLLEPCPRDRQRLFFVYAVGEVRDGVLHARPLPHQSSGNLHNPARADLLLVIEPGSDPVPAGAKVPAQRIVPGR